jgi:predicted nucleic acid-binding protein
VLLAEPRRTALLKELERDPDMLVWWGTPIECISAITRREREGALSLADAAVAIDRVRTLRRGWQEVLPSEVVRDTAQRILRVHPLRTADSLQLAAALVAAEREPASLPFVSLDERLSEAATREGFPILRG